MKYFIGNNLFEYKGFINTTIEHCVEYCEQQKVLGLDIETGRKYPKKTYNEKIYKPGLDPYVSRIVMLQIGDLENQFIIDTRYININSLKDILENKKILKVGHNLKFETKHLIISNKIFLRNIHDTMICERILYNGERISYSLENLAYRHLGATKVVAEYDLFEDSEEDEEYEYNELDAIDGKYDNFKIDKSIRLNFVEIEERPFYQKEVEYALDDIIMPLLLRDIQIKGREVNEDYYKPLKAFSFENRFTPVLAQVELKGIKLDIKKWTELFDHNNKKRREINIFLDDYILKSHSKFVLLDLFNPQGVCNIKWESSKQVIELFRHLKICPKAFSNQTKKIEYTVGAKELFKKLIPENKEKFMKIILPEKIENTQDLMLAYLIFKKYQLYTTTFGMDFLKFVHPITKRIHTNLIQLKNTGRMASLSVNCQQIPNPKVWRECFISEKGNKLIARDYSQQEARVASEVHNEPKMQDFFINGSNKYEDMHCFVASLVFSNMYNKPDLIITTKEKEERNKAKTILFKILFGGSAYTLAQDFSITEEEAQKMVDSFMNSFPGLTESFEISKKEAVKKGWVQTCVYTDKRYFFPDFELMNNLQQEFFSYYGKEYQALNMQERKEYKENLYKTKPHVKGLNSQSGKLRGKLERTSLNFKIQGSASTAMKICIILAEENNRNLKQGMLLPIHDEGLFEFPENIIEQKDKELENHFAKAGSFICKNVPMTSVGEIGNYWIH